MEIKTKLKTFLAVGIVLALGPIWGLMGTCVGMVMAFQTMGSSGMGKPEALAGDIGVALYTTAAGLIICPVGIVCIIVAAIKLSRMMNETANSIPDIPSIS